jgi:hypothetical protein
LDFEQEATEVTEKDGTLNQERDQLFTFFDFLSVASVTSCSKVFVFLESPKAITPAVW